MKEYNTYQEAKIAHPRSDIYTRLGKFAPGEMPCEMHERWEKCEPQDYLLSVSGFINDGYKITAGDLYIDIDGRVEEMSKSDEDSNQIDPIDDDKRYVLRANAFKRKIPTESTQEREALDMIGTRSKQVESLAKGDVVEWKNGDDCIYTGQPELKCKFVSIHPNNNKCAIIWEGGGDINLSCVAIDCLSKPESPEQKSERERLEAAFEVYLAFWSASKSTIITMNMSEFKECSDLNYWLAVVDKTGYRKQ